MPSLPGHAGDQGLRWQAYTGSASYPVDFYRQLFDQPNIVHCKHLLTDASALPQLSILWHDSPDDEYLPGDVSHCQSAIGQTVDATDAAGHWDDAVFLLNWNDWDSHVATLNLEHSPATSCRCCPGRATRKMSMTLTT